LGHSRISIWENKSSPQGFMLPMKELPEIPKQKRKRQATRSMPEWKICGADTETIDGKVWIFSTEYGVYYPKTLYDLLEIMYDKKHARYWKKSKATKNGAKRGISSKEFFFWNLKYDAQAIFKLFSDDVINDLIVGENGKFESVVNAQTGTKEPGDYMVKITYLEGKMLSFTPKNWYYNNRYKAGAITWWDISQFYYKARLNTAAKNYLGKTKLETCFDGSILDAGKFKHKAYREFYAEDIEKYALIDAQLTGELARKMRNDFVSQGIRFIQPYSLANVAQRALLDMCKIPTINGYLEHDTDLLAAANSAYQGGWFETIGMGLKTGITSYDIASAYPYIMYHLPDITKGSWIEGDIESEWYEWLEIREPYSMGFVEAIFEFDPKNGWNPLTKKRSTGTLVSPNRISGWFTADEVVEALAWNPTEVIFGQWFYFVPDDSETYPFRAFIDKFYRMKTENKNDPVAYKVSKVLINSIYGKTIQAVNDRAGKLWNPFYAATICGATRARLCEFNRLNQFSAVSYATDGVVLDKSDDIILPPRPKPAVYNLGEWEYDGAGEVLIVMSGVYTLKLEDSITTKFRGSASYFVRKYLETGLHEFCKDNENESIIFCDVYKPYSAREAKQKSDYGLINIFEERHYSMSVVGDSTKRVWESTPETFGELLTTWFSSKPHESLN